MTPVQISPVNMHTACEQKLKFQKPGMHFHFGNTAGKCLLFMYRCCDCEHNNHCVFK